MRISDWSSDVCSSDLSVPGAARPAFKVVESIDAKLRARLERFLNIAGIEIAGIEFATGRHGPLVYDVNTNTNYNAKDEAAADLELTGMGADRKSGVSGKSVNEREGHSVRRRRKKTKQDSKK